ncbi:MAG TPA: cell division regulator GpsB [Lysinibacillus sp.]|jgi:DivIVA domain-containing protein|uniref:Cell division regulator GpsB n=1 Tax=Lysinibacillus fusiformis TaxID=28031 RepID=A0A2I0V3B6_9BACI|nr:MULTISPECIES: cell division regulator GpsB [Lysinibacillus]HBT72029.1 cell division regulator GpsB [Lysinibacillus sp.]KUF29277.1 cell division protein DivIVA [Lysinibacillus sp. F5]MEE3808791.1 cell division regulator GpsB [Lysinibacillus fusiformis]PKU52789.1 cell division regulator GpsB [Lysinibacillus fusiformis]WCH49254.1 cell division regulator GpsB [Lysinibacillus sp. OF-1]
MDIKLTSKMILEKEFKKNFKGYNVEEVDSFLDEIIQDYETFEKAVAQLREENRQLKEEIDSTPKRQPVASAAAGTTNFDILKRLSNLEKHVFGSKLYE